MRATALFLMLAVLPALASEPGQPLDCSDWVFVEPGLSCSVYAPLYSLDDADGLVRRGSNKVVDNEGDLLALHLNGTWLGFSTLELVRLHGPVTTVIAYVADRVPAGCNTAGCPADKARGTNGACEGLQNCDGDRANWLREVLTFDPVRGRLLIPLRVLCQTLQGLACDENYIPGTWIAAIDGFPTTFDILQTYTPTSDLSFRVPAIPEGLPGADFFDTYYGDLATVGDWTHAQPLQCGYPASPPAVGDYLEVADLLPNPDPGQGRYYVTAVHYQGHTRYGRKRIDGVLSGRDPAVLPPCSE